MKVLTTTLSSVSLLQAGMKLTAIGTSSQTPLRALTAQSRMSLMFLRNLKTANSSQAFGKRQSASTDIGTDLLITSSTPETLHICFRRLRAIHICLMRADTELPALFPTTSQMTVHYFGTIAARTARLLSSQVLKSLKTTASSTM